ncbi:hypothetical protein [Nocardioides sp.]|uniref:hypothetical protein n=1 Tax=Nocardioides sp. TaxID=35761 RepID=UPI0027372698|nr:hypothetical protein [Nocardioides sp.]MDP3894632.1 hypothetical protein [Nocardioides sp.]
MHAKFAHNADKVDGKHAVGAGASLAQAKKKLVAHDSTGQLPAKFIPNSFVTESEYNSRPGTRLIAGGLVGSNGTAGGGNDHITLGVWSSEKTGTGAYTIRYRSPALCAKPSWPVVHLTKAFSSGQIYNLTTSRDCTNNTYATQVRTADPSGNLADSSFHFTIYGPGETVGPAPTARPLGKSGGDDASGVGAAD